jgi:hypothetical protein
MSSLILSSLEIHNFRLLRNIRIERLGRVNLFVGKNNVGKSSILEAIQLYIYQDSAILDLLRARDEFRESPSLDDSVSSLFSGIKHLFHNQEDTNGNHSPIQIGSVDSPSDRLSIRLGFYTPGQNGEGESSWLPIEEQEIVNVLIPALAIRVGTQKETILPLDRFLRRPALSRVLSKKIPLVFIPANGLSKAEIGKLWDEGIQQGFKDDILDILRIVSPEIEDLHLIGQSHRTPVVRVKRQKELVALRSLGEGTNRLFGMAVALVNAQSGLLLVDEIESGLHYSVFPKMWEIVFETASRLNIQVFATTHSLDCVQGFQEAATENQEEEGVLYRLENRGDVIVPILFDEQLLTVAAENDLEVR